MNVRVNRAERLFKMFDEDRDDKIYWTSFKEGIKGDDKDGVSKDDDGPKAIEK